MHGQQNIKFGKDIVVQVDTTTLFAAIKVYEV
jgi:hypothetical protein